MSAPTIHPGDLVAIPCGVREEQPFHDGTRQGTAVIHDGWGLITVDWEGEAIHDGALHGEVIEVRANGSADVLIFSGKAPRKANLNPAALCVVASGQREAA